MHVAWRWSRNAHIQHHDRIFRRITGHGISAEDRLVIVCFKVPQVIFFPIRMVFFLDIKFFVAQLIWRNVDLNISAGLKVQYLSLR